MSLSYSWHSEPHFIERSGWLRASVLGANDGIVSTASLIVGVAAASVGRPEILLAGIAGLVAGAMSMAAGEYVSVSSQADSEQADLDRERRELIDNPELELNELVTIYESRGLDPELARRVAEQLTQHDALEAHARDELGLSDVHLARPIQAATASALAFAVGAVLPLGVAVISPLPRIGVFVSLGSLASLATLGAVAARAGGAKALKGCVRVTLWGAVAMAATALVGRAFGAVL